MNKKGQGTIEYLVILAIIVVIALVVVTILSQFTGQGTAIRKQNSDGAWKSANPIQIIETQKVASTGALTLVIKNAGSEGAITLTNLQLSSTDINTDDINLSVGQQYTTTLGSTSTCTSGSLFTYPKAGVAITYNTASITGKVQSAPDDLIIQCS